jgi:KAP family P-loop domain
VTEDDELMNMSASPALTIDDLILDRALEGEDRDEFQRAEIAARIAELACSAELPLNIGLFGPWGSGKSSMFLLIEQAIALAGTRSRPDGASPADVALIRYDAWKYGGHSLRRNFISNAASALGIGADDSQGYQFHRGLYEQRRSAEIQTRRFFAASLRAAISFAWLFLLFILLSAAVVGITSWLTGKKVGEVSPKLLAGGGIVTLILALVRAIFETGTVQVEQTWPSDDEEFSAAFRALIKRATARLPDRGVSRHLAAYRHWRLDPKRDLLAKLRRWWSGIGEDEQTRRWRATYPGYRRLIFFIDELDRCAEADVVKTLNALRTFLDEHDCAFIVAADRAVLEQALEREAQQVTPINREAPYYSAAGAFLDKIFQYQIGLPPLRRRRLTAFAREKVQECKVGIWSELRGAGLVDRVLPALIPTQVQSPRRVKVLLNNFAASARIAQSRGVQWPQRAPEIAKLVALQTEFPHFAQALASEPRLSRLLLLDIEELPDNEALRGLWHRLRAAGADEVFLADEEPQTSSDRTARESERQTAWDQMTQRQAQNLLNFLRATDDIEGPQSDLIYLEPAGATFHLDDPVLGDRIEHDAADVPDEVAAEIGERKPEEQCRAIELLGSIMPDSVGRQRANELAVLLATAERLHTQDELAERAARAAARALQLYLAASELDDQQLLGALAIGISARDESLIATLFGDDRLLIDAERVQAVAQLYDRLPRSPRAAVARSVAGQLAGTPSVLVEPMCTLSENDAVDLYNAKESAAPSPPRSMSATSRQARWSAGSSAPRFPAMARPTQCSCEPCSITWSDSPARSSTRSFRHITPRSARGYPMMLASTATSSNSGARPVRRTGRVGVRRWPSRLRAAAPSCPRFS